MERCTAQWPAGPLGWCTHPGWLAVSCKHTHTHTHHYPVLQCERPTGHHLPCPRKNSEFRGWKWHFCRGSGESHPAMRSLEADLSRRVCCLLRIEGLDSKMWGLFLFLPVATAAAAAMPTGPERERKSKLDSRLKQQMMRGNNVQLIISTCFVPPTVELSVLNIYLLHGCSYLLLCFELIRGKFTRHLNGLINGWLTGGNTEKCQQEARTEWHCLHKTVHWHHLLFSWKHDIMLKLTILWDS